MKFWPILVLSRRSCERYRCAGCMAVISNLWSCSAASVLQPLACGCGVCSEVNVKVNSQRWEGNLDLVVFLVQLSVYAGEAGSRPGC